MKNDKAADGTGIVAEMIKFGGDGLFDLIAHLFNDVLMNNALPLEEWRHTRIKFLFKKGRHRISSQLSAYIASTKFFINCSAAFFMNV